MPNLNRSGSNTRRQDPAVDDPPARRRHWFSGLLWLALALMVGATAVAVTPACGIALPWADRQFGFCHPPLQATATVPAELETLMVRQRLLEQEVDALRLRLIRAPACPAPEPEPEPEPEREVAEFEPPQPVSGPPPAIPAPPAAPARQALPAVPDPPQAPSPPADDRLRIPDDVGDTGDLGFLAGCWRTDPFRHRPSQSSPGMSVYCFDAEGRGSLSFRRDGLVCEAPARVEILPGGRLRIWDADTTCNDGSDWYQDRLDCSATGDGIARCSGESSFDNRWTVYLHRR